MRTYLDDDLDSNRLIDLLRLAGHEKISPRSAVEPDHFTMLPDREAAPVQIAYGEVRYVEKNISLGSTIVLVVLIPAAVIVVSAVLATR